MYNPTGFIGIDKRFIIMPIQKNSIIKFTKNSSHIVLCPSLLVALTLEDSYHCMTNRMNSNQDVKFQGLVFKSNLILILFVMACMSLFATSVVGECDYPSHEVDLNSKQHPIQCITCELVVRALEGWLIDPTDEQAVMYILCIE